MIDPTHKKNFIQMVRESALEMGDFTLKSGKKSSFYLDLRKITLDSKGLDLAVTLLDNMIPYIGVQAIGGPSIGADPLVGGLLCRRAYMKHHQRGFLIRKESKDHGKDGLVIGSVRPNDKVTIVEDVTTSGMSAMRAVDVIEGFGCKVVQVVSLVDRLDGAGDLFRDRNIHFQPVATISDILE